MIQNPKILVDYFVERDDFFEGKKRTAVTAYLECGHSITMGISDLRPRRMACVSCGVIMRGGNQWHRIEDGLPDTNRPFFGLHHDGSIMTLEWLKNLHTWQNITHWRQDPK